jgi:hypothetical protein
VTSLLTAALEARRVAQLAAVEKPKGGRPRRGGKRGAYWKDGKAEAEVRLPAVPRIGREPLRPCVGCAVETVRGWRYCGRCRRRLALGYPVDVDLGQRASASEVTYREARKCGG